MDYFSKEKIIGRKFHKIYIYGAGRWGQFVYTYLESNGIQVDGFIVSQMKENQDDSLLPVYEYNEIVESLEENDLIIIAIKGEISTQIHKRISQDTLSCILLVHSIPNYVKRELYTNFSRKELIEEIKRQYFIVNKEELDLDNPQKFTEKIAWLNLFDCTEIKSRLADKYLVREWISKKIGAQYLVPILGTWEKFEDIDWDNLPSKIMLKCNHGCCMNKVVEKKSMDYSQLKLLFDRWISENYGYEFLEFHYFKIKPIILAEQYIEQLDKNLLDYKVHCFNGIPRYIQVIGNRDLDKHTAYESVYDFDWNMMSWTTGTYEKHRFPVDKPICLNELYELNRRLCEGFTYIRLDFYILEGKILFGEATFTPGASHYKYGNDWTKEVDISLGELLKLDVK